MNKGGNFQHSRIWPLFSTAAIIVATLQSCASSGTSPDDMSAEAHRAAAAAEQQQATEHLLQYDPEREVRPRPGYLGNTAIYYDPNIYWDPFDPYGYAYYDYFWDVGSYNPGVSHLDSAEQLDSHAADHLAAAQVLETFEEAECKAFPSETRAASPLIGQVESVEAVFGGVSLSFKEGVDVNAATAHMRCHVAFARTRGRIGMESCPLYIPGISINRVGNSGVVELTIGDQNQLLELRQRVQEHLDVEITDDSQAR